MTDAGARTQDVAPRRQRFTLGPSMERRVGRFALLIVALAVLVCGLGGYLATRIAAVGAVDDVLAASSADALHALGPDPDRAAIDRYLSSSGEPGTIVTTVVLADGQVFSRPGSAVITVQDRDLAVAAGQGGAGTHRATTDTGQRYWVQVVPVGPRSGVALLVGQPFAAEQQILDALALALVVFGLIAVGAAGLVGRRVARTGVAPVLALAAELEQRAADDDLAPVGVSGIDEIGRLAVAFNLVLDSIQVSRARQVRFIGDVSHELRTPLTSMRTNVDLLAADSDRGMLVPEDRLAIITDVKAQVMELSTLVSDLIGLTREDRPSADFELIDLSAVLEDAVGQTRKRAPGLRWALDVDPVTLHGDAGLLTRAFANVLDNAVKYSPPGGTVSVSLRGTVVSIADEGVGVRPDERSLVFDRFYRSEASRATRGTGLGLAISESAVRQHGGTIGVTDAPGGGALFVLTLAAGLTPAAWDAAPAHAGSAR